MTYGNSWPFSEMADGYQLEAEDDLAAEQADREARQDRLDDYAPAPYALALERMATDVAERPS